MSSVISCLIRKSEQNLINKKTLASVQEVVDRLTANAGPGPQAAKEIAVAKAVLGEIEDRIAQRSLQAAIMADLVTQGIKRVDDLRAKGLTTSEIASTLSVPDEALSWKYGYLGETAFEKVQHHQAVLTGMLSDAMDKLTPKTFALFKNPKHNKEMVEELFRLAKDMPANPNTLPDVATAAKAVHDVSLLGGKALRKAGADLRTLKSFMIGYRHNIEKMHSLGEQKWVDLMIDTVDLAPIYDRFPNTRNASDLRDMLGVIYKDIVSGGNVSISDYVPKNLKSSANRRSHHRWLQPKDAESYLRYHNEASEVSVLKHIHEYVHNTGRDLGALEFYGPKPETFINAITRRLAEMDPINATDIVNTVRRHAAFVMGARTDTAASASPRLQKYLATIRNINVLKLGSTAVSALVQEPTFVKTMALKLRGLPILKSFGQQLKILLSTPGNRKALFKELAETGIFMDGFVQKSATLSHRLGLEGGHKAASQFAQATMEYTGLNVLTNSTKGSAALTLASTIAETPWDGLTAQTRTWLSNNGFTPSLYKEIQDLGSVDLKEWGVKSIDILKLSEIGRQDLAEAASRMVYRISELVSPTSNPNFASLVRTAEQSNKGFQFGVGLMRTFTGYPSSWYFNHIRTAANIPGYGAKAATFMATATGLAVTSIAVVMIMDALNGKTPDLNNETVLRGLQRSGFLPILSDFILAQVGGSYQSESLADKLFGPSFGFVNDVAKAAGQALGGEFAKAGNTLVGASKSLVPFSTAWYSKLLMERLLWDNLRMAYDPKAHEAFKRSISKANKDGTPYWWKPGTGLTGLK